MGSIDFWTASNSIFALIVLAILAHAAESWVIFTAIRRWNHRNYRSHNKYVGVTIPHDNWKSYSCFSFCRVKSIQFDSSRVESIGSSRLENREFSRVESSQVEPGPGPRPTYSTFAFCMHSQKKKKRCLTTRLKIQWFDFRFRPIKPGSVWA